MPGLLQTFPYFLCGGKESKCLPRTGANANKPLTIQGKANTISKQTESAAQANNPRIRTKPQSPTPRTRQGREGNGAKSQAAMSKQPPAGQAKTYD